MSNYMQDEKYKMENFVFGPHLASFPHEKKIAQFLYRFKSNR